MIWEVTSTGSADTEKLGELLASSVEAPLVIELRSDLGGGKTTFVRGLVRGLGSNDGVSSPTFTLQKIYHGKKDIEIHHFDFYRLNEAGVVADELAESLADPNVITAVEWSDIVADVLPEQRLSIEFSPTSDDSEERKITIHYPESMSSAIKQTETRWTELKP
jgi:tRNA threonylcarbamoyladenosine biosynthesis protein TsaE